MAHPNAAAPPAPDEPAIPDRERSGAQAPPGRDPDPVRHDSAEEPGPVESEEDIPSEDPGDD